MIKVAQQCAPRDSRYSLARERRRWAQSQGRMKYLAVAIVAVVAAGCARSTPSALADVVFRRELAQLSAEFVPCVSVDGKDADTKLLDDIRKLRPNVVLGSECIYDFGGSYHRA